MAVKDDKIKLLDVTSPHASADSTLLSPSTHKDLQTQDICRICFESTQRNNHLISPCRCTGSVKYVHQECLKLWLLASTGEDISKACCELCSEPFLMEMKVVWRCSSKNFMADKLMQMCFLPLLLIALCTLLVILGILTRKYVEGDYDDEEQKNCTLVIIFTCLCTIGIIVYLIDNIVREGCCLHSLRAWVILSQNFPDTKLNKAPIEEIPQVQMNLLTVPGRVKVQGVMVDAPQVLIEAFETVKKNNGSVSYRHKCASSERLSVTRRSMGYSQTISYI